MSESGSSLLILDDDCIMEIFKRLDLVDYPNLANTCHRIQDVARYYGSLKIKKIKIEATKNGVFADYTISMGKFLKVLDVAPDVLEMELLFNRHCPHILKAINEKCKKLESIEACFLYGKIAPQCLQYFQNLKKLKVLSLRIIKIREWKNIFASNPGLESLDYDFLRGSHRDGFLELLPLLPRLQSLALPHLRTNYRILEILHLYRLTELKQLRFRNKSNMNETLALLAMLPNLVELNIEMEFNENSLGIIKSFKNLKVLSIKTLFNWSNAWFTDPTVFLPTLKCLEIAGKKIWCRDFLLIIEHLVMLEEFNVGSGKILWDDNTLNPKNKRAMLIESIENVLSNGRKLKIIHNDNTQNSLYVHRSERLQIINSRFIAQQAESHCIFVHHYTPNETPNC